MPTQSLWREHILPFTVLIVLLVAGTLAGDYLLHRLNLVWLGRYRPEPHLSAKILRPVHAASGGLTSAVPIMESLVTRSASRSSLQPSVPAGRMGTTR